MRARRLLGRLAAGIAAALLLVLAAGVWWAGQTTSFLRWALAQATTATGGAVEAGEVRGTLFGGFAVSRLTWREGEVLVEVHELELGWRPEWLFAGELRLAAVRAARVEVSVGAGGDEAPPGLPERIALPLKAGIDELEIRELVVRGDGFELPPVRALVATLRHDGVAWKVPRLAARVDGLAALSAEGQVDAAAPFDSRLAARIQPALADYPKLPLLLIDAAGPLAALEARVRMRAPSAQAVASEPGAMPVWVTAEATVRPLEPLPLREILLSLDGFEPDAIGLPGPRARLAGTVNLELVDAKPFALRGRLALRNALPGPIDKGLAPVSSLSAEIGWQAGKLAVDALDVDGGTLRGSVAVDTTATQQLFGVRLPAIEAKLALRAFDLARLHHQAWPTRLGGSVSLARDRVQFALDDAQRKDLALSGDARIDADTVRIAALRLRTPSGSLDAAGSARWRKPWTLDLAGRFDRLDPVRLAAIAGVELPARAAGLEDLSGQWAAQGEVAPGLALDSRLRLEEGRFEGRPLRVDWRGRVASDQLSGIALSATLGDLSVKLAGDAGRVGDRLSVDLRLPSLAAIDPALAGRLRVEGELAVPGLDAEALERTRAALRAEARSLRHADLAADEVRLAVDGTLGAHRLDLALAGAKAGATPIAGAAVARGGLVLPAAGAGQGGSRDAQGAARPGGSWRWDGVVERLSTTAPLAVTLAEPMPLVLEADGVQAGPASLVADGGQVDLARLVLREGRFDVAGEARSLPVSRWAERFGLIPPAAASIDDVRLGGRWVLAGSSVDDLDGELSLRIVTTARLEGDGEANVRLADGQLSGSVDLKLPSLAVANRAIGPEWAAGGRLRVVAELGGTLRTPKLRGSLEGRELVLVQRRLGWRLADGTLDARFDGDRLEVDDLRLGSGQGSVRLSGSLVLDGMRGQFRLLADRLAVPLGPGQRIVVSGDTTVTSKATEMQWKGKIRADEGLIELRGGEAPSLPDDVVVVDASAPPAPAAREGAAAAESKLKLGADLELDLGDRIRVRGSGVDARLAGSITLRGTLPEAPRATGTVRVRDGTYTAYGRKLEISRGRVIFNGPLDNPALDIVAMRRGTTVEAGVAVTGTVLSPRVRLVSEPDVPDSQKLSWLVLGVGLEDVESGAQAAALQAAAATLFGRNDGGMTGGLQEAIGLDVLTIRNAAQSGFDPNFGKTFPGQPGTSTTSTTAATQEVVAIGKRLSSRVLVTYEHGLRGVWSLLRLQYDITRRLSVRAQTGTDTAIDLLYFYSFD